MRITVVGAGYAGTIAANRLARQAPSAQVTVVNPRADFVHRVRLHQRIAGNDDATVPLRRMLAPSVALRIGSVDKIGDGSVSLADGDVVGHDYLLYAAGGAVRAPSGTVAVGELESADEARAALAALPDGARVTVVGGGLTGVETAAEVAEARPGLAVRLVSDEIAPSVGPAARQRILDVLDDLGVQVEVGRYSPDGADLVLWAIASTVSGLAEASGLAVDEAGRAIVDPYLRSVSDPRVFAVGDAAAVPKARLACATAMPAGSHAAGNLARIAAGRELEPFAIGYAGQCVSLGRQAAVLQLCHPDDTPRRQWLWGRPAVVSKELVCRGVLVAARKGLPVPTLGRA
ncbi:FAD-dependent oxidoreductase [Tsukamurella sp. 8F]|uniref:NAD(P)/FAD-dependent oxidoreductase n=1 Tax=unclassified Tsukamurella TaxID=2633480 RepID=UPI0023B918B5|nr:MULTISPECIES: FAD-dependent oxidoreductase [unclassified Tsukamurella]MDF0532127.1 FAD-dependent oxidoreductase [Tsukamurella sp. 8J]MDF0585168.1 FAD-dependent oxidoreductase [Tsukamurella sp. 8F]